MAFNKHIYAIQQWVTDWLTECRRERYRRLVRCRWSWLHQLCWTLDTCTVQSHLLWRSSDSTTVVRLQRRRITRPQCPEAGRPPTSDLDLDLERDPGRDLEVRSGGGVDWTNGGLGVWMATAFHRWKTATKRPTLTPTTSCRLWTTALALEVDRRRHSEDALNLRTLATLRKTGASTADLWTPEKLYTAAATHHRCSLYLFSVCAKNYSVWLEENTDS